MGSAGLRDAAAIGSIFYEFGPEYYVAMAIIHISVSDLPRDLDRLLAQVRAGGEVMIEEGSVPIAVMHAPSPVKRTFAEAIALMKKTSTVVVDDEFPQDVEAAIAAHNQPWEPPAWD